MNSLVAVIILRPILITLFISGASSFSTLITFDVDGTLVSSSPGWEEGAHGKSFTHAVNSVLIKDDDFNEKAAKIPQLL